MEHNNHGREPTDAELLASALAHRACCGTEHNPETGKLHGYCVVCGVPWPCATAERFMASGARPMPPAPDEVAGLKREIFALKEEYEQIRTKQLELLTRNEALTARVAKLETLMREVVNGFQGC